MSPPSLNFGAVDLGSQLTKTLAVSNGGAAPVDIQGASIAEQDGDGGLVQFSLVSFSPEQIAPASSVQLSISFAPTVEGPHVATLSLMTDTAQGSPVAVALTGSGVIGETTPPVDGGQPDGGQPDSGPPPSNPAGCADGTREGYLDEQTYPAIAACSGAWSSPGVTGVYNPDGGPALPVVPMCNHQGGNDSPNPGGQGCSAADLCAAGWHICQGYEEVAADTGGAGCADAVPSGFPNTPNPGVLFAIAQHECQNFVCDDATSTCDVAGDDNDNDIHGCGTLGNGMTASDDCGPLTTAIGSEQPNTCGWNQAMPPIGPWSCQGSNSYNEGDWVTKDGCQNDSCSYSGNPIGTDDLGGVLCCQDQ